MVSSAVRARIEQEMLRRLHAALESEEVSSAISDFALDLVSDQILAKSRVAETPRLTRGSLPTLPQVSLGEPGGDPRSQGGSPEKRPAKRRRRTVRDDVPPDEGQAGQTGISHPQRTNSSPRKNSKELILDHMSSSSEQSHAEPANNPDLGTNVYDFAQMLNGQARGKQVAEIVSASAPPQQEVQKKREEEQQPDKNGASFAVPVDASDGHGSQPDELDSDGSISSVLDGVSPSKSTGARDTLVRRFKDTEVNAIRRVLGDLRPETVTPELWRTAVNEVNALGGSWDVNAIKRKHKALVGRTQGRLRQARTPRTEEGRSKTSKRVDDRQ